MTIIEMFGNSGKTDRNRELTGIQTRNAAIPRQETLVERIPHTHTPLFPSRLKEQLARVRRLVAGSIPYVAGMNRIVVQANTNQETVAQRGGVLGKPFVNATPRVMYHTTCLQRSMIDSWPREWTLNVDYLSPPDLLLSRSPARPRRTIDAYCGGVNHGPGLCAWLLPSSSVSSAK